eukprot:15357739-Ditylum_brightwellii.AAC.1
MMLALCAGLNHDKCVLMCPSPTCPVGSHHSISDCGGGVGCSSLFGQSLRHVKSHPSAQRRCDNIVLVGNAIGTICNSQQMEECFIKQHKWNSDLWQNFDINLLRIHFGALNSAFQQYPIHCAKICTQYDSWIVGKHKYPEQSN